MIYIRDPQTGETRTIESNQLDRALKCGWVTFSPPPQPIASPPVPEQVTNAQFREALIDVGIMPDQVDAVIEQIQDPLVKAKAKSRWNYANHIERSNPLIAALAPAFGMTDGQVDNLFRAALSL